MKLELKPFDFAQAAARAGLRTDGTPLGGAGAASKPQATEESPSFQVAIAQALRAVSDAQNTTKALQEEVQLGNPEVSFEQTMIAMQKSQLGFTAALSVRNRLVQAYTDIMNMQV
ncbi:flagellar hook-basal body complex protein FliE [Ideonella sp. DXS22W]|uniref:Flagellar hook-basal body complex protein FliE n=1 Tax=Pseudaquabacterium inlustre TaxID=2984192 RepID=A0ABU9CAN8_9BURK